MRCRDSLRRCEIVEPCDEPDELTPSSFNAGFVGLVFSFATVFSFGPLAGYRGRSSPEP